MKNLLYFVFVSSILCFSSCVDNDTSVPKVDIEPTSESRTLSEFSQSDYPLENDIWIITDQTASFNDFVGLSNAIDDVSTTTSRKIYLEFPNLKSFPSYAILGNTTFTEWGASSALVSLKAECASSVGKYAFSSCKNLTSIDLPNAVYIGSQSFWFCTNLVDVNLPIAEDIGADAFVECRYLVTISLPMAKELGYYAFWGCDNLKSIYLPELTYADSGAFRECNSLAVMEIATNEGVKISNSINGSIFNSTDTSVIDLVVGSANSSYVNGTKLTIGSNSWEFASITICDN